MSRALPKGHLMVSLGLAAVTGAGFGLAFTVLDDASIGPAVSVLVIVLGGVPSPSRLAVAGAEACLALSNQRNGRHFRGMGHWRAAWFGHSLRWLCDHDGRDLRWGSILGLLHRLDSAAVPWSIARPWHDREPPSRSITGGGLLLRGPQRALYCYALCRGILVRHPGPNWNDWSGCRGRHRLERSPQRSLVLPWAGTVPALPGGVGCADGLCGNCTSVWTRRSDPCDACYLECIQMETPCGPLRSVPWMSMFTRTAH